MGCIHPPRKTRLGPPLPETPKKNGKRWVTHNQLRIENEGRPQGRFGGSGERSNILPRTTDRIKIPAPSRCRSDHRKTLNPEEIVRLGGRRFWWPAGSCSAELPDWFGNGPWRISWGRCRLRMRFGQHCGSQIFSRIFSGKVSCQPRSSRFTLVSWLGRTRRMLIMWRAWSARFWLC
jgi:hypothetical protein